MIGWCLSTAPWKPSKDATDVSGLGVVAVRSGATRFWSVACSSSCLFRFSVYIVGRCPVVFGSCAIAIWCWCLSVREMTTTSVDVRVC